jgi:DNA-binding SARP family transcriptional activator
MTSFRILGPIEAWRGENRLEVGGPRQLALLAFLLLHANRAVATDGLVDALWGPARTANDNRLHMAIARLRKALAPLDEADRPRVRTVRGGYLLRVRADELDAELFATGVDEGMEMLEGGDPPGAAARLRAALSLWRGTGPPLAEVAFEDFAQDEIRRLEELRLVALEARIAADLELGRHQQLVGELEGLLRRNPLRERVAAQLMLALYRSGRQAESLEVYQRIRVQLAEQLGLEPGPALKSLQAEILQQASSVGGDAGHPTRAPGAKTLARQVPLPSRLKPYGPSVFVDRHAEMEALRQAVANSAPGGPSAAFITGELGIGKTRLVGEVASAAHAKGTLVLAGRCDEGLDLPYQPFVDALEHLVEHAPDEMLADHVARYGESLARLVPTLGSRVSVSPPEAPADGESERYVLYRAIEGLLSASGADGPVLLVLEDLHWGDLPTLKLVRRLLGSPRRSPLTLMVTCRTGELADDHPVRALLADAHREPRTLRLDLGGLPAADIGALVTGIGPDRPIAADDDLVSSLHAGTDGNPFFISEIVRNLLETGRLERHEGRLQMAGDLDPASALPVSIAETLDRRLRRLGEDVLRCLRVAAVIGYEFDLELVSELAGVAAPAVAVDAAVDASVVGLVPGHAARFRFAHSLMQRVLYRDLGAAQRAQVHERVADVIEARLDEGRWPIAELARHCLAAGGGREPAAVRYASLAGDEALIKIAPDEARRWYATALDLLSHRARPPQAEMCELLVRRGEAERQAGDRQFRATLLEAGALAQQIGSGPLLVRAALANTRGMQSQTGIVDTERMDMLDAALGEVADRDQRLRARLLAMQAAELMNSGEWERRVRLSDEALALARELDDPDTLSRVLNLRFVTLLAPETHGERCANAIEAVGAAERLDDPIAAFFAYHWRGYASIEAGDVADARSWLAREREIADRFRQPTTLWLARADEANLAIIAGELDLADRLSASALELGRHSEPDAVACHDAQRASIAFEAGRLGEAAPMLEQAVAENPGVPGFRATLALALSELGQLDEARALLAQEAHTHFRALPRDVTWLTATCLYAQVSVRVQDQASARTLYGLLEPWADQVAFPAFGVWAPVALHLAALALTAGEPECADRHLSAAAELASRAGAPLWAARVTALA